MWLHPVPIGIELGRGGGACNRELPRILLLGRWVNRGQERFSLSCCDCETHLVCVKALGPWDILYVLIGSAHPPMTYSLWGSLRRLPRTPSRRSAQNSPSTHSGE